MQIQNSVFIITGGASGLGAATARMIAENGGKTVILARFIPIVRTIAPFVAGAGEMKYRTYLLYCITGAFIWVSSITLLGYFLGNIEWVKLNFEKFS